VRFLREESLFAFNVQEDKTVVEALPFSKSKTKSQVESSSRAEFR